ncbi:MAG: hypothetical protein JSW71_05350 [Gemmatimonadota bacterium]|nr:MAG: hypothetical protein JSW71_05350 [Gemmatimonadota bacterium]
MKRERREANVTDSSGVKWQCAWFWQPVRDPMPNKTRVYLRRLDDGAGEHTHEVIANCAPDTFSEGLIDGDFTPRPRRPMGITIKFG